MNDYIIIALLVILIVIIIFKNKKNDNQDSYDPLKHEGYNKDIKEDIYALYPSVGENLDYINSINLKNIKFLYRKIDKYSWKFCNKGFFNFKNYIPKIVQEFI